MARTLTLPGASLVACALFGLTFTAAPDDGILRAAAAVGVRFVMCGLVLAVLVVRTFSDLDIGK